MINVLVVTANRDRLRAPAAHIQSRPAEFNMTVKTVTHLPGSVSRDVVQVRIPYETDVLVLSQPMGPKAIDALRWLHRHMPHVGIVVDLMHAPDGEDHEQLVRVCRAADVVTSSCQVLAGFYGKHARRSLTIRDAVPASMLSQHSRALSRGRGRNLDTQDRVIGWAGHPIQSQSDLCAMYGALRDVVGADRTGGRRVRFRSIGPREGLAEALMLDPRDVEASGPLPADLRLAALGEVDVAVRPVDEMGDFSTRSALRVIEFAAAGVPVIASSTFEHRWLRDNGMPLWLVNEEKIEWLRALRAMMSYDDLELHDLAAQHRENVRQHHTIEKRVGHWADAWRSAAHVMDGRATSPAEVSSNRRA